MKKSVLFVIDVLKYGGAQRVLLNHANFLKRQGVRVSIFSIKDDIEFNIPKGINVYKALGKDQKITENIFYVLEKLNEAVKRHDLIIGFMDFITNYITVLSSKTNKKPVFISVRNTLSEEINKFDYKRINHDLTTLTYNMADKVICPASYIKDDVVLNFNITRRKTKVLYNPVDIKLIGALKKQNIEPEYEKVFDGKTILSIGRLEKQKNYEALIYAFRRLFKSYKEDVKLVIIGEGSLREELENVIERTGLRRKVFLIGKQHNIYKFLCRSDLFVLPSIYEGMPNVVLEAMAVGVPVIASNLGPIREIISDGKNGLLFETNNIKDMSEKILSLLTDTKKTEKIKERAFKDIESYDIDRIGLQLMNVLGLEK
jgi:glycosyltransferase involved in cell wall biosynthesis